MWGRYSDDYRQGQEDFERSGRYGYDHWRYDNHFSESDMNYTNGFRESREEEDRRREQAEEERIQEERAQRRQAEERRQQRDAEEAEEYDYYERMRCELEQERMRETYCNQPNH